MHSLVRIRCHLRSNDVERHRNGQVAELAHAADNEVLYRSDPILSRHRLVRSLDAGVREEVQSLLEGRLEGAVVHAGVEAG